MSITSFSCRTSDFRESREGRRTCGLQAAGTTLLQAKSSWLCDGDFRRLEKRHWRLGWWDGGGLRLSPSWLHNPATVACVFPVTSSSCPCYSAASSSVSSFGEWLALAAAHVVASYRHRSSAGCRLSSRHRASGECLSLLVVPSVNT
ncbi:hypothetical protein PIB30_023423 [Stylosanthes scabra]|uniref:Uncharacterized protein n=1 Tax=Stylosanthes scabra TaxID=79078 RepID=A0ABU6Y9Z2_9FABA|nr:hypothetical protein [Stylosanthes scabra]